MQKTSRTQKSGKPVRGNSAQGDLFDCIPGLHQEQLKEKPMPNTTIYEHHLSSVSEIKSALSSVGTTIILAKPLPKNANDKNQVYWSSSIDSLAPLFDLKFGERDFSTSVTKRRSNSSKRIPEAVFQKFQWLTADGRLVKAPNVKMVAYAQYPEMRLSGFKTVWNDIPESMGVNYVKNHPDLKRILVLARTPDAGAVAMVVIPKEGLLEELKRTCPKFPGSNVVHVVDETTGHTEELKLKLRGVVNRWMPGVRFDKNGNTLAFNGTQVCGYTLEHALDIRPNANKDGDFKGIELKAYTRKKVTLMTPEPDCGEYAEDFAGFMKHRGYRDASGAYRLTGVHTAGTESSRSGLTLTVENYDRDTDLSRQLDKDIRVALLTRTGELAAGWSLERLMNCWGAKHNEAVYVPAARRDRQSSGTGPEGHKYEVEFSEQVLWCKGTTPEKLLNAILDGIIVLDPAPKYVENNPSANKRRSQWRVKDLTQACVALYDHVELVNVSE